MSDLIKLSEQFAGTSPHKVDRVQGIIFDVKILGHESRNGYRYMPEAIKEAAKAYEGLGSYIDHSYDEQGGERKMNDLFGRFENVRCTETEARGDLHFLKSHPMAERVCEAAERFPQNFGISHDAYGKKAVVDGETVIESVPSVNSIDIVTSPATNKGLFESFKPNGAVMSKKKFSTNIRKLLEGIAKAKGDKVLSRLKEAGPMGPATGAVLDAPVDVMADPGADGAEPSPDVMLQDAINAQILAIVGDAKMDTKGKLTAVGQILEAQDALKAAVDGGGSSTPPPADKPAGDEPAKESAAMKELREKLAKAEGAVALHESQKKTRKLIVDSEVEPTDELVEALTALGDEAKQKKLLESLPKRSHYSGFGTVGDRPDNSAPLRESTGGDDKYPEDAKSFAAAIK